MALLSRRRTWLDPNVAEARDVSPAHRDISKIVSARCMMAHRTLTLTPTLTLTFTPTLTLSLSLTPTLTRWKLAKSSTLKMAKAEPTNAAERSNASPKAERLAQARPSVFSLTLTLTPTSP